MTASFAFAYPQTAHTYIVLVNGLKHNDPIGGRTGIVFSDNRGHAARPLTLVRPPPLPFPSSSTHNPTIAEEAVISNGSDSSSKTLETSEFYPRTVTWDATARGPGHSVPRWRWGERREVHKRQSVL